MKLVLTSRICSELHYYDRPNGYMSHYLPNDTTHNIDAYDHPNWLYFRVARLRRRHLAIWLFRPMPQYILFRGAEQLWLILGRQQ
jgi:hypothetical protein